MLRFDHFHVVATKKNVNVPLSEVGQPDSGIVQSGLLDFSDGVHLSQPVRHGRAPVLVSRVLASGLRGSLERLLARSAVEQGHGIAAAEAAGTESRDFRAGKGERATAPAHESRPRHLLRQVGRCGGRKATRSSRQAVHRQPVRVQRAGQITERLIGKLPRSMTAPHQEGIGLGPEDGEVHAAISGRVITLPSWASLRQSRSRWRKSGQPGPVPACPPRVAARSVPRARAPGKGRELVRCKDLTAKIGRARRRSGSGGYRCAPPSPPGRLPEQRQWLLCLNRVSFATANAPQAAAPRVAVPRMLRLVAGGEARGGGRRRPDVGAPPLARSRRPAASIQLGAPPWRPAA